MKYKTRIVRGVVAAFAALGVIAASLVVAEAAYAADTVSLSASPATVLSNAPSTFTLSVSCSTTGGCANSTVTIPTTSIAGDAPTTDIGSWFTNGNCPAMTKSAGQISFAYGNISTGSSTCTFTVKAPDKTTVNGAVATLTPTFTNSGGSTTGSPATLTITANHNASLGAGTSGSVFPGAPMTLTFTVGCGSANSQGDVGLSAINVSDLLPSNFTFTSVTTAPVSLTGALTTPAVGSSGGTITYTGNGTDCANPANNRIVFTVNGTAAAGGTADAIGAKICHQPTASFTYTDTTTGSGNPAQACATVVDINYLAGKSVSPRTLSDGGQYKALDGTTPGLYTFPGDWDHSGGDTTYTFTEATSPTTTNSGLSYLIQDPLPCVDQVSGVTWSGTVGTTCVDPAYVPTKITVTGFTPTTSDSINLRFANGTTGSVPYVSGTGWTMPASPAISEIDIPAFIEEGSNTLGTMTFTVSGYATATDAPGHILHNVSTNTAYYSGTTDMVKTPQLRGADVLVADPTVDSGTVIFPSLTSNYAATCIDRVQVNNSVNGALRNQIELANAPSQAIYLDYLSPANPVSITNTTETFTLIGPGNRTYTATGVTATQTPNYHGTGRTLVEWMIPAGVVQLPGLYQINASAVWSVQLPLGCAGTYPNAMTVGYGGALNGCYWDNYHTGFEQAAPLDPPGDTVLDTNGSPITGNFCGYSDPLVVPATGTSFSVDKSVQGNLDSSPVNAGGVGKVTPSGGSATYDVTFANNGQSNLHDPVMYDILPAVGDTESTTTTARNSQFAVDLTSVTTPPANVTVEYSTNENPCRPEVLANTSNPGCTDDWTTTPPSPLSLTRALRFFYSGTVGVSGSGYTQSFTVEYKVSTPDNLTPGEQAWNTVGTNVHIGDTGDDNPTDDPYVGAAESSRTGLTASTNSPAIVKSASESTYSTVGETIAFDFDVTNTEDVPLTGVSVDDSFTDAASGDVAPTVTCAELSNPDAACSGTTTPLAAGQVAHFVASYNVTQADLDHGVLSDSAVVSALAEGAPISNTSNVVTATADVTRGLTIAKTSPTANYSAVGDEVDYNFLLTNTGTQTLDGVAVSDSLIPGVTCPTETIAPNTSITCTGSYEATQADLDAGEIDNTATASALGPQNQAVNSNESSAVVHAVQHGILTLAKTASVSSVAAVGDPITFFYQVTNTGNVTLNSVGITEGTFTGHGTLSEVSCPGTTLAPTDAMQCSATYAATQADLDAGDISNTATATGDTPLDAPVTSAESTADVSVASHATLSLTKTADVTEVTTVGQIVTYSFEIKNTGNVTVTDVIVQEGHFTGTGTLSAIDCPAGVSSMAPGDDLTCSATYAVTAADLKSGELSNTAVATGSDGATTVASADSTAAVTSDSPATVPPVLGTTGVDVDGGLWLAVGLLGLGALVFLLRRRRRNA